MIKYERFRILYERKKSRTITQWKEKNYPQLTNTSYPVRFFYLSYHASFSYFYPMTHHADDIVSRDYGGVTDQK